MRMRSSKKPTIVLVTLAVAVALTSCGVKDTATDSAESGEVTVMYQAGVVEEQFTKSVIDPFMEKFPDIKVTYIAKPNSAEMIAHLAATKGNPDVDVNLMSLGLAHGAAQYYAPLDPSKVPNMADVSPLGIVDGIPGPAVTFDNLTIMYNTEKVSSPPTVWEDLWDPMHKGKVAVNAAPNILGTSLMLLMNDKAGASYKDSIEPGMQKIKELAPSVQTWSPSPDAYTLTINGELDVALGWNARSQFYASQSDGKLGVVTPVEGSIFDMNMINLIKGSKNSEAAQTFINYALSPEAQTTYAENMFYAPTNEKVKLSDAVASKLVATQTDRQKMMVVDWKFVASKTNDWTRAWQTEVLSK